MMPIFVLLLASFLKADASCSECCQLGGTCGDPVYEDCNGEWDYGVDCEPYYAVCCVPDTRPTLPTFPPTGTVSDGTPGVSTTTRTPGQPGECGRRPPVQDDYIVGGVESEPNSWPWMVSLVFDYFGIGDWEHYCGGSLIYDQWVITAAHCYVKSGESDPSYFRIIAGAHYKDQWTGNEIIAEIESFHPHELYDPEVDGSPNDLCLIKLKEPLQLSDTINLACLPEYFEQEFLDEYCIITGWGLTKGTGDEDVLNEAEIDVITNAVCDYKWEVGSGRVGLIKESHICVGNGLPEGACNGDSGGPLNCQINGTWIVAGSTSFGAAGCQSEDAPNVYTRTSHFLDWVDYTIARNGGYVYADPIW